MRRKERGQATAATIFAVIIFTLLAGAIVDVYTAWTAREWAYRAASSAAMRGVTVGRDFYVFAVTGQWQLDESAARAEAIAALAEETALQGVSSYQFDVRVLPDPGGGSIAGYPPVSRANQSGGDWSAAEPSVGVYLVVPVRTYFLNMVNGGQDFEIHVFAAAGIP